MPHQHASAPTPPADPRLLQGIACQRGGDLNSAELFYREVLRGNPHHADALQLMGAVRISQQRHEDALVFLDHALRGRPGNAIALRNRSHALRALGRSAEALQAIERALRVEPGHVDARLAHAQLLMDMERPADAKVAFERILATDPRCVAALCGSARLFALDGDYEAAELLYDAALAIEPDRVEAWGERGTVRGNLQRHIDALADYEEVLRRSPANAEALYNKGVTLAGLRRFHEAVECFDASRTGSSTDARALNNLGFARLQLSQLKAAVQAFDAALSRNPQLVPAMVNQAEALRRLGQLPESIAMYERAFAVDPATASWQGDNYLYTLQRLCDWVKYPELESHVLARTSGEAIPDSPLVLIGLASTREQQRAAARKMVRWEVVAAHPPMSGPHIESRERLRIAYVSGNFNPHPVGYVTARLFEQHDRAAFEIIGISLTSHDESPIGQRIRHAMDGFHEVQGIADRDAAALIRSLGVDIAVDLMGHTNGHRQQVFAHRPAPVQVNFLGYPGTLGAPWMDYILADRFVIPPDHLSAYDEKVVWLPGCYMPGDEWQPPAGRATLRREDLGLPGEDRVVFGCFNTHHKITPAMFDLWAQILREVEGSVLWLRDGAPELRQNLQREAGSRGLDPARLVFAPRVDTVEEHRARVAAMDLFLDTTPYNAHSTARDVLEAGVPLLTRIGDTFAGRVAGSILHTAGIDELITTSPVEYVERAILLGRDRSMREALRARLAAQLPTCPLFDTASYARDVEVAYRGMAKDSSGR